MISGKGFKHLLNRGAGENPGIICTLGTTTDAEDVLREMVQYGMACARINTAYADVSEYKRRIDTLRGIKGLPVILDLKGSQIRITAADKYRIEVGDEFPVGFQRGDIAFNHDFFDEIAPGDLVLFENGTIRTVVSEKKNRYVVLRVVEAGGYHLANHMGVNIPNRLFRGIPLLTPKDLEVIDFALRENIELLAISFARSSQNVLELRNKIVEKGGDPNQVQIVIKIEDPTGFQNLQEIITASKKEGIELAVMIGRGDMFVECQQGQLPFIQKRIIRLCRELDTPVIVATGLLESMQYNRYPTRSEVCDTANAVLDGADWLMLSAETSNSRWPVEAVRMLSDIIKECQIDLGAK